MLAAVFLCVNERERAFKIGAVNHVEDSLKALIKPNDILIKLFIYNTKEQEILNKKSKH